jgi:hypothetical protein
VEVLVAGDKDRSLCFGLVVCDEPAMGGEFDCYLSCDEAAA